MKLEEILLISAYEGMEITIGEVCRELDIEPSIMNWELSTPAFVDELKRRFTSSFQPKVIISRGALADLAEQHYKDIIVVRAEPSELDMVDAIMLASTYGDRIGVLLHERDAKQYNFNIIKNIMNLKEVRIYPFRSRDDIIHQVINGKNDGMNSMAGGGTLSVRTGKEINMPVCFAATGKLALQKAIYQAMAILRVLNAQTEYLYYLKYATEFVKEGIMVIDNQSITYTNEVIYDIFKNDLSSSKEVSIKSLSAFSPKITSQLLSIINSEGSESLIDINNSSYLVKSYRLSGNSNKVFLIFSNVNRIQSQEQTIRGVLHKKGLIAKYHFNDIICRSHSMKELVACAIQYSTTEANILITGESGTGKELFAQSIHNNSKRANAPFVAINCASIPNDLLESELFGYEEGSFSGAKKGGKPGLFELADHGTIFLDEIDSLPINLQGVLLRVLQEKEVHRIGSDKNISIDVRVIAATNINMNKALAENKFRIDLYYRLNTFLIVIPPLRDRKDDIIPLANFFIHKYTNQYNIKNITLSINDEGLLIKHNWYGNVRELENVISRYVMLNNSSPTGIERCFDSLCMDIVSKTKALKQDDCFTIKKDTMEAMEKELIRLCVKDNNGNQTAAARSLNICRTTLWKKLNE